MSYLSQNPTPAHARAVDGNPRPTVRRNWLPIVPALLLAGAITAAVPQARGQLGPEGGVAGVTATQPTSRGATRPIEVLQPTVDKAAQSVSLPAAFWNEKMTGWVEVAVCGRPSDFLHETIVSTTTTKAVMVAALRDAGFADADAWVANVADFPRIRGDKAMIVLEFKRGGAAGDKVEKYLLEECLTFQGWGGVSIGPWGWMYKGAPGEKPAATQATTQNARERILRDDPQVAVTFRGIQHMSQSYMDAPLAYDDWIYPAMRFYRNLDALPQEIYDSNGDIEVTMTIKKVTEEEYLRQAAKLWHDPGFSKAMLEQIETAKQIDRSKAALWETLPKLRKRAHAIATGDEHAFLSDTPEFGQVALLAAGIEKGYTTLDAAWTVYAAEHAKFGAGSDADAHDIAELKGQAKMWCDHMLDKKERAEALSDAETAAQKIRELKKADGAGEQAEDEMQKAVGAETEARAKALLAENRQALVYWRYQKERIAADDPRKDWIKHIDIQVELAAAREEVGKTGMALGQTMTAIASDSKLHSNGAPGGKEASIHMAHTQAAYQKALLRATIAGLQLQLSDVEFEISKRQGIDADDPELKALTTRRDNLQAQIQHAQGHDH